MGCRKELRVCGARRSCRPRRRLPADPRPREAGFPRGDFRILAFKQDLFSGLFATGASLRQGTCFFLGAPCLPRRIWERSPFTCRTFPIAVGPSRVWRGAQGSGISGAQGRRSIKAPCGRATRLIEIQHLTQNDPSEIAWAILHIPLCFKEFCGTGMFRFFLEVLERLPIAVCFNRPLDRVRQVGKEVKTSPRFYVIHAYRVVGIG